MKTDEHDGLHEEEGFRGWGVKEELVCPVNGQDMQDSTLTLNSSSASFCEQSPWEAEDRRRETHTQTDRKHHQHHRQRDHLMYRHQEACFPPHN